VLREEELSANFADYYTHTHGAMPLLCDSRISFQTRKVLCLLLPFHVLDDFKQFGVYNPNIKRMQKEEKSHYCRLELCYLCFTLLRA
jgi:hypothetical protein